MQHYLPVCTNYMARDALIAVIACVYREGIPEQPQAEVSREEEKKAIAPSREKENKVRVRRRVLPNFRLNDDGFSEIAVSVDDLFAKYSRSYMTCI